MKMQFLYFLEGGRNRRNARRVPDNDAATWHNFMKMHTARNVNTTRAMQSCAVKSAIGIVSHSDARLQSKWGKNVKAVR